MPTYPSSRLGVNDLQYHNKHPSILTLPRLARTRLAPTLLVICLFAGASGQLVGQTANRLKALRGTLEQTQILLQGNRYRIRRAFLQAETGNVATFTYLGESESIPDPELLLSHLTPATLAGGFFGLKDFDAYWNVSRGRWTKMPKGYIQSPSNIADESVFFTSEPSIAAKLHGLRERLSLAKTDDERRPATDEIKSLESIEGPYSLRIGGRKQPRELHFNVSKDGIIQKLEVLDGLKVTEVVLNIFVAQFPDIPSDMDVSDYEQFASINVNDNGMIGVRLETQVGKLMVAEIAPGSPAAEAGMVIGEEVLAVNGKSLSSPTVEDFRTLTKGPPSVTIKTRDTHGQTKEYKVGKTVHLRLPSSPAPSEPGD